jgi:type VI secretion system protein ImpL
VTTRLLLIAISSLIGALALALVIWFVGPLVAIGETHPFDAVWLRLLLIGILFAVVLAGLALAWLRRRKAQALIARSLEGEAGGEEANPGDAAVLADKMKDALATLRKSSGAKGDYLYDLPWYVIIGPPGAGKTTALVNAGLKFPLARGLSPAAIAGVGGTRYCDWWFTDEAVLLDTAGRYTTQDSDAKADQKSWRAFLELLRENRPRQPINGVLLCISLEDLIAGGPELANLHAEACRARLIELHEELKIDFPVYVLFTKADLVAGFSEFFGHLNEQGRRAVWGATFQTDDKTENHVDRAGTEFDLLIERLNLDLIDRLQDEPNPASKVQILGFPSQMAASRATIVDFLGRVFEPTRYHANATLRGFYFTSGTQKGSPIDRLIGALSRSFGAEEAAAASYSGIGKSYFLTDLITRVIVGEAGWVSTNRAAVRRNAATRIAAYAMLGTLTLGALAAWWISYRNNSGLIEQAFQAATRYKQIGEDVSTESIIADGDLSRPLRHLHHVRTLPAGHAERETPTPLGETFGLSQRVRLNSAAESAYQAALERHFRPRLLYRIESELRTRQDDAGYAFQALPVYLMLGGREAMDREKVTAFLTDDWEQNQFRGAANADGRRALGEHLAALLAFDPPEAERAIVLDENLIQETQKALGRLGVVERGFELMRGFGARQAHRDWIARTRGGQDVERVFEAQGGEGLEAVRVPFLFTYDGFHEIFLGRMAEVRGIVEKDRRLMGAVADQLALQKQFDEFEQALLRRYNQEFVKAWETGLRRLRIKALTADRPRYVALDAAARATSPLIALFESIRAETQLTRERPKPAGQAPAAAAQPPKLSLPAGTVPGAEIEAAFRPMHVVVEAQGGKRIIDDVIKNLSDIHQSLMAMQDPAQAAGAQQMFRVHLQSLNGNSTRLPPPFATMLQTAANAFDQDATGSTIARLQRALAEQVTEPCRVATQNKYPFTRGAGAEISIPDFERLFATNGIIDRFFQVNLASFADTTRREWVWNPTSPVGRQLPPALIRDFQRAAAIRETYLRTGAAGFGFVARNMTMPPGAQQVRLEINGAIATTDAPEVTAPRGPLDGLFGAPQPAAPKAPVAPTQMQWPGPAGLQRAAIVLQDASGRVATQQKDGPWGLFRLLDGANVQKAGETVMARFGVGGQEVAYAINVPAGENPLTSPLLRNFRCPGAP